MRVYAGIDGGATKTRAVLTDETGHFLAEGRAGPSNYQTVGAEVALANFTAALGDALHTAEALPLHLAGVVCGFAGLDTPGDLAAVEAMMQRAAGGWGAQLAWCAVNDVVVAWAGALAAQPGAIVMSGTGAIAFAVNGQGQSVRSDGWGHWLGDEGSGFDIGRQGLMAALRALDGRGEATAMVDVLMTHGAQQSAGEWSAWLAQIAQDDADSHGQISSFSPHVSRLAAAGDRVCVQILEQAADSLVRTATSVIRRSDQADRRGDEFLPVAVGGSVLANDALVRNRFTACLTQLYPHCRVIDPHSQPAEGAALLARQPWRLPDDVLAVKG